MKKIKSLFKRDYAGNRQIYDEVLEESAWVFEDSENVTATIKFDGTSCLILDGKLYKRYDAKHGKTAPEGAIPCTPEPDPNTGHHPHWIEVKQDDPSSKWHLQADLTGLKDGTYELIGEKIQGNPHNIVGQMLVKHGELMIKNSELVSFEAIKEYLSEITIEGIVWHHSDGRMAKVKAKDFGIKHEHYINHWFRGNPMYPLTGSGGDL